MGTPISSKTRRWVGVGLVIFSMRWPVKLIVSLSSLLRCSSRSRKLRTGSPSGVSLFLSLVLALDERWARETALSR
jgi:hypothetical protein